MADLKKGLVGHWTCDSSDIDSGILSDSTSYGNDAVLNGSETIGSAGKVGESLSYPGGGGTFSQEATIDISNVTLTGFHTITAWVYFDSGATGGSGNLGNAFFGDHTFSGPTFFADNDNQNLRFWDENPDGNINLATSYTPDEWIHATGVKDGTDIRLYTDANLASSGTLPSNSASVSTNLFIGGKDSESSFDGRVDDCRFWTRALSESEINQLYQMRTQQHRYV